MSRFYFLFIILQLYCLWHAYSNRSGQKWLMIIFFLPVLGSLFYLYTHFYSRENIVAVKDGIQGLVNKNHHLRGLEEQLTFSDTKQNRCNLAEAYMGKVRYQEAIDLLESCLKDFNLGNKDVKKGLVKAYYLNEEYKRAVHYGNELAEDRDFEDSIEKVAYAWSLYHIGEVNLAEKAFSEMDARYCNYSHRLEYAQFLFTTNQKREAKEKLEELLSESERMNSSERKLHRDVFHNIRAAHENLAHEG